MYLGHSNYISSLKNAINGYINKNSEISGYYGLEKMNAVSKIIDLEIALRVAIKSVRCYCVLCLPLLTIVFFSVRHLSSRTTSANRTRTAIRHVCCQPPSSQLYSHT